MLDVDTPRKIPAQIADEFFVGRRVLKRVILHEIQQSLCLCLKSRSLEARLIFFRLFAELNEVHYHASFGSYVAQVSSGSWSAARMLAVIPGMAFR